MIFKLAKGAALLGLIAVLGAIVFVRITPIDPALHHLGSYPSGLGHMEPSNGHIWRSLQTGDGSAQMATFDQIIRATPRTDWLAGSIDDGMISYVTYSKWWRFPDVTTLERNIGLIEGGPPAIGIHGRAVYGVSDLGVNKGRVAEWLRLAQIGG